MFQGAQVAGANCETINLASMKITPCAACQHCHATESLSHCIYEEKDDVLEIFNHMRESDLIIFATPVYVFSMSGKMKTFLDRLHSAGNADTFMITKQGLFFHYVDRGICGKPFVTLVCCDNLESETTKNVVGYFKTYAKFMDANNVGVLIRTSGAATGQGKDPEKEQSFPRIQEVYKAYYQAGKELALNGRISRKTQRKANQKVIHIPPMIKQLARFKPVQKIIIEKEKKMM
jgi:multimeric flavodoxin WrbA